MAGRIRVHDLRLDVIRPAPDGGDDVITLGEGMNVLCLRACCCSYERFRRLIV